MPELGLDIFDAMRGKTIVTFSEDSYTVSDNRIILYSGLVDKTFHASRLAALDDFGYNDLKNRYMEAMETNRDSVRTTSQKRDFVDAFIAEHGEMPDQGLCLIFTVVDEDIMMEPEKHTFFHKSGEIARIE